MARSLMGQFRRGEPLDPGAYVTTIAAVLSRYPIDVMTAVADPRLATALVAKTDFLPTAREVSAACEEIMSAKALIDRLDRGTRETLARRETEPVRVDRPSLDDLRAKHGPNWGLHPKEEKPMEEEQRIAAMSAKQLDREQQKILAEYQRIGGEPVYAGEFLLSPSLVKNLRP